MSRTFERAGVRFEYPAGWQVEADDTDSGWAVTLVSPETAFVLVSLRADADTPGRVADETLAALRADYPGLDAEPAVETLAGRPAVGYDVEFLTLDTAAEARVRCLDTPAGPLLVLAQATAHDRTRVAPAVRAVFASLRIDAD